MLQDGRHQSSESEVSGKHLPDGLCRCGYALREELRHLLVEVLHGAGHLVRYVVQRLRKLPSPFNKRLGVVLDGIVDPLEIILKMLRSVVSPIEDAVPDGGEDLFCLLLVLADDRLDVRHLVLQLRHGNGHRFYRSEGRLVSPILHPGRLLRSDVLQEREVFSHLLQLGIDGGQLLWTLSHQLFLFQIRNLLLQCTDKPGCRFHREVLILEPLHHLSGLLNSLLLHSRCIGLDPRFFLQFLVLDLDGGSEKFLLTLEFAVGTKVVGFHHCASSDKSSVVWHKSPLDGVLLHIRFLLPDIGQLGLQFLQR